MAVYFIQAGDNGPVKIGTAVNVGNRLRTLQTGSAANLRLIRTVDGGRDVEVAFHRMFAEHKARGEWFSFVPAMMTATAVPAEPKSATSKPAKVYSDFYVSHMAPIEQAARAAKVSIESLCFAAGIERTTWTRWKNGSNGANFKSWQRVQEGARELGLSV